MRIDQILEERRPVFSFEFFPPKDDEGTERLFNTVAELKKDEPDFVSVTYGAGGSTRDRTISVVKRIRQELDVEAMAHFSVVGADRDALMATLDDMQAAGIENVLALRGDPPKGETEWRPAPGGLQYSSELAALIAENYDFAVGAACFPEVHPEAESMAHDIDFLKEKVAAGVRFLITQLFFDNDFYFDFVDEARAAGITVPIVPGIMPISNHKQIKRFTDMCGASIPPALERGLSDRANEDGTGVEDFGVAYATLQCTELLARGAPGIHFYTLNKSPATRAILGALRAARPWDRSLQPA
jgi:methylenetetrahydrofolate reductase (NADPH)